MPIDSMPRLNTHADPLAMGLAAYGITMTFLCVTNSGLLPADGELVAIPMGLVLGGLVGFISGLLMYRTGSIFWMTAFIGTGAFFWWLALEHAYVDIGWSHWKGLDSTLGVASFMWMTLILLLWVSTFRMLKLYFFMFLTLWLMFFSSGLVYVFLGYDKGPELLHIFSYFGIVSGMIAVYASFALITNATFERTVIPLGTHSFL